MSCSARFWSSHSGQRKSSSVGIEDEEARRGDARQQALDHDLPQTPRDQKSNGWPLSRTTRMPSTCLPQRLPVVRALAHHQHRRVEQRRRPRSRPSEDRAIAAHRRPRRRRCSRGRRRRTITTIRIDARASARIRRVDDSAAPTRLPQLASWPGRLVARLARPAAASRRAARARRRPGACGRRRRRLRGPARRRGAGGCGAGRAGRPGGALGPAAAGPAPPPGAGSGDLSRIPWARTLVPRGDRRLT